MPFFKLRHIIVLVMLLFVVSSVLAIPLYPNVSMKFTKTDLVYGTGGNIEFTSPELNTGIGGSSVFAYVGAREDNWSQYIKWGWLKTSATAYTLYAQWFDLGVGVRGWTVSAPIPISPSFRHYDFHYNEVLNTHYFFMDHQQKFSLAAGAGSGYLIDLTFSDVTFAGVEVGPELVEDLRNPPDINSNFDCRIGFTSLQWYKEKNAAPGQFVWKDWGQSAVMEWETFASYNYQNNYRYFWLSNTGFLAYSYQPNPPNPPDPCV